MINAVSRSFSVSIDDVLNDAIRFGKQYGFIVVVVGHMNEDQNDIANIASQLYPVLKKSVRITDTIFRFFQDSWVICLDDCDDHLLEWTQYILQSVLHRCSAQMLSPLEGSLTFIRGFFLQENAVTEAMQAFEHEIQVAKNSLHQLKTMRSTALISIEPF